MPGVIEAINTSPAHGTLQSSVDSAELLVGVGLEGDRYANADGGAVSIIEAEQVEAFNDATGLGISAAVTGRNLVTRGVRLNPLVGKQFKLGEATLECFELCEPCASLAARLSTETVTAAEVVKAFTHSAGIRARVVTSGSIEPGAPVSD
jgi:MOSC domain-containing protein YiiM